MHIKLGVQVFDNIPITEIKLCLGHTSSKLDTKAASCTIDCVSPEELDKKTKKLGKIDQVRDSPVRSKEQEIIEQIFVDMYFRDD